MMFYLATAVVGAIVGMNSETNIGMTISCFLVGLYGGLARRGDFG